MAAGNYSFVATTNRLKNGKPEVVFTQAITIKSEEAQSFTAQLTAVDTGLNLPWQKIRLRTNFMELKAGKPAPVIQVSYYLGSSVQPVVSGYGETEADIYELSIPTHLLKQGSNILHVQLWYKNDTKELNMALPAYKQPAQVAFYPEGGNIMNNLPNVVGIEVKTAANDPLHATATLYENNQPIKTFETSDYGLGRFTFIPKAGNSYWVKLTNLIQKDTAYSLPKTITRGSVINIKQGLVNDTLDVQVNNNSNEKLYLQVHNFKQLLFSVPLSLNKGKHLKILLDSVPKGLMQLSLTDSMGRPYAERIFFAHYNKRSPVEINTDQPSYNTRKKVTVKVKLNGAITDTALVSISCVQTSRMEARKKNDIESYVYLKSKLEELPLREPYIGNEEADRQYLEDVLLIKGWRRYKWTDVLQATPADTLMNYTDAVIKGQVVQMDNKPIKRPVSLINIKNPLDPITTDARGMFELNNTNLLADSGNKANIILLEKHPELYHIRLNNPYTIINEHFAVQLQPKEYFYKGQESTQYMQLPDNEHSILLKDVNIKGSKNNSEAFNKRGIDEDGFVIIYIGNYEYDNEGNPNYLRIMGYRTTEPVSSFKIQVNGIYQAREFYPVDFSEQPSEQGFLSTLYWKYMIPLFGDKEAEFSFYTGDITGRFKIIIQGITTNDVTYGEAEFIVSKPK